MAIADWTDISSVAASVQLHKINLPKTARALGPMQKNGDNGQEWGRNLLRFEKLDFGKDPNILFIS
jgi:hypothetical protein